MRNTPYEGYKGIRLPRELQLERIRTVMQEELTVRQREVMVAYYIHHKNVRQIAEEAGRNKSTIWRTLVRAENKLRRYLRY